MGYKALTERMNGDVNLIGLQAVLAQFCVQISHVKIGWA